jgi:hypothetical protein
MKYSLTQGGILIAVLGTLAVQFLGSSGISETCSNELASTIPLLIGGITSWIGRYRRGGVTIAGFKK